MNAPLSTRAARGVGVGLVLMAMFVFFFVYPGHDPEPNDLPIAVQQGIPFQAPGFEVHEVSDEGEARQLIRDREVYGAVLRDGVLVASAASFTVAQILREAAQGQKVVDVVPLDRDDPRGTSINLMLLPLLITGILSAMLMVQMAPDLRLRPRIGVAVLTAVLGGLVVMAIVRLGIGVLPGSYLALSGVAALVLLAVYLPAGALIRIVGPPGVGLAFLIFLMLGIPSSGAAAAPELLPSPWAEGGHFLQAGAGSAAIRSTAYFDGAALTLPLLVLGAWVAIGLALHVLAERRNAPADV